MECVPLIDVSAEDDLLVPSSCQASGYIEKRTKQIEQVPELSESPEQKRKRSDKYNLRKSLAWDSAFLSSEGILKPEELAIMNSTYFKSSGVALPGIQEELGKLSESCSTLDSESWALEDLEVNLFGNIRASVQKSLGNSNQASDVMHPNLTKKQKKPDVATLRTLKKVGISSQNKLKPPIAMESRVATRQQHGNSSNDGLVRVKVSSCGNGDSKPSIRSPKVSSKLAFPPAAAPGKICSSQTVRIKCKPGKAFPGTSTSSTSISTDSKIVSSLASIRKRSADRSTGYSSSRIISRTSLKACKTRSMEGGPESTLVISKVSPTSSVDSIASESSSSSSVSVKLCMSLEGSNARSLSSSEAFSSAVGTSQNSGTIPKACIERCSKSYVNIDSSAKHAMPSGLRMPRPRSGFFDKEKSLVHGANKNLQTCLQTSKNAQIYEIAAVNKSKPGNLLPIRAGAVLTAPSSLASNSSEGQFDHGNAENFHELCPNVDKFSSVKSFEKVKNDPNVTNINIEKENVFPASKPEGPSKSLELEESHKVAVGKLGEMVSLLSITEGARNALATV